MKPCLLCKEHNDNQNMKPMITVENLEKFYRTEEVQTVALQQQRMTRFR